MDDKIKEIDRQIETWSIKLKVSQSMLADGNKMLEEAVAAKNINKTNITEAQSKISIGFEKCQEIQQQIDCLNKEKHSLTNEAAAKKKK